VNNKIILVVILQVVGTVFIWRDATQARTISGLEKKNEILKSVACKYPVELEIEIIDLIKSTKAELNPKQSDEELRSLYSIGCTKVN
jgi:hypothetical protein